MSFLKAHSGFVEFRCLHTAFFVYQALGITRTPEKKLRHRWAHSGRNPIQNTNQAELH
jgi:hypothetical protein